MLIQHDLRRWKVVLREVNAAGEEGEAAQGQAAYAGPARPAGGQSGEGGGEGMADGAAALARPGPEEERDEEGQQQVEGLGEVEHGE